MKLREGRHHGKPRDVNISECLRLLTTGGSTDIFDDACYMAKETTNEYLEMFCLNASDI